MLLFDVFFGTAADILQETPLRADKNHSRTSLLVGHSDERIVSAYGSLQLGGIDLLALPIRAD